LETTILEGDGAEVVRLISTRFLREKNNIQFVDWAKVRKKGMEVGKRLEDIVFDQVPVVFEESGAETVRFQILELVFS
jgi:hypothetical protein